MVKGSEWGCGQHTNLMATVWELSRFVPIARQMDRVRKERLEVVKKNGQETDLRK